MQIEKTNKVIAYIAHLPVTALCFEFVYRIKAPIELAPLYSRKITTMAVMIGMPIEETMKSIVLGQWKEALATRSEDIPEETAWLYEINEVELVECDLLVPKTNPT